MNKMIIALLILITPSAAYAYLDPGTGTVLINLIVAGIAAAIYFMRDFILRLFGKGKRAADAGKDDKKAPKISIFSEGRQYWGTFKPIVEALIQNQVPFKYYTLDIKDPALAMENDCMQSEFLGEGSWGYTKFSRITSEVLLATTPNIGNSGYPLKRPAGVASLIHVFHSINDLSMYRTGSLDAYDAVILAGDFQIPSIREIEKLRGLKPKELLPLGLPYLDELLSEKNDASPASGDKQTVLVGSSWGAKGCLQSYGTGFIKQTAQAGYHVIVRPHPQSFISEADLIKRCKNELESFSNVEWDELLSPSTSMNRADIMVSDTSSIRFDFAFLYEKPVITLSISADEMPGYEREHLKEIWDDKASYEIGFVIKRSSINELPHYIERALAEFDSSRIRQIRDETIHNFGQAGVAIAKHLAQYYKN